MMTEKRNNAIIYVGKPSEPRVIHSSSNRTFIAAAPNPVVAAELAVNLTEEKGVDDIELCGGTGVRWLPEVRSAVSEDVTIGLVTYPFEGLKDIANLKARYESGNAPAEEGEVFLFLAEDVDPSADRIVDHHENGWTAFVPVGDVLQAALVATDLAVEGATLIELYGGFDLEDADTIYKVTNGEVPIGIASYGLYATHNTKIPFD